MERKDKIIERLQNKLRKKNKENQEEPKGTKKIIKLVSSLNDLDEKASNFYDNKQFKEACETYKKLLEALSQLKDLEAANNFSITDQTIVNTHYMLGRVYFSVKDFDNATIHFKKAQSKNKNYKYYEIMYYLGAINYTKRNYGASEANFRAAIKDPNQNECCCIAYYNLGLGLLEGKFEPFQAEENVQTIINYFLKAINYIPKEVNISIGMAYLKQNEVNEAINFLKIAANLNDPDGYKQLAYIYLDEKYGLNMAELALTCFEKAAGLGDAASAFNAAYLYDVGDLVQRDVQKALFWYQEAIKRDFPAAFYNLGLKYLEGEDVAIDYNYAFELFKKAAERNHSTAFNELGRCYLNGRGVAIDLDKAKENYQKAFAAGILEAGNNLACLCFEQSDSEIDFSTKKEYLHQAIEAWQILSKKDHSVANFNLGLIYHLGLNVSPSFEKAESFYLQAGNLGLSPAWVNLAILYLNKFLQIKGNQQDNNDLIEKFKKALEQGQQLGNESAKKIYELFLIEKDYQLLFKKVKKFKQATCIKSNKDAIGIAGDIDLTPEQRINKILKTLSKSPLDIINLSTTIHLIGKLYQVSQFNPAFLASIISQITPLTNLIVRNAEYLNPWSLTRIIKGLASLQVDSLQSNIAPLFDIISEIVNNQIRSLTSFQSLSILRAVALLGTKNLTLLKLSENLVKELVKNPLKMEEITQLIYDLAFLENYQNNITDEKGLFFEKDIYQIIIKQIPKVEALIDINYLNQIYMGLFYFSRVLKLDIFNEENVIKYFTPEVISKIRKENSVVANENFIPKRSALQSQVTSYLKKFFPTLEEEFFIDTLPVDIYIKGVCIIQVDGPRHFLFNFEKGEKSRTPKDLLHNIILEISAPEKRLHIPYDEWQLAMTNNNIYAYLQEKFLTVKYELPQLAKQVDAEKSRTLTFKYQTQAFKEQPISLEEVSKNTKKKVRN